MSTPKLSSRAATLLTAFGLVFCSFQASPEDIDIFSVDENSSVNNPNVLFIIDNSANWSRQAQQWPESETQGQSEASAISTVLDDLDDGINVGLMEYITGGSAGENDSAYIRYHIRPMTDANKAAMKAALATMYDNIESPDEKRSTGNPFGNLFWDVYNYLSSDIPSQKGLGTLSALADPAAYDSQFDDFRSPLTSNDSCARTIIIFMGNNQSSGPSPDSTDNVAALRALAEAAVVDSGDTAIAQIPFADYVVSTTNATTDIAYSSACYASAAACGTAENTAACTDQGFLSCSCDATDTIACPSTHWNVIGTNTESKTTLDSDDTVSIANQYTDEATFCRNSVPPGACTLPPGTTTVVSANTPTAGQTTTTETSWSGACAYVDTGTSCGSGGKTTWEPRGTKVVRTVVTTTTSDTQITSLGETDACYTTAAACNPADGAWNCSDYNAGCTCTTAGGTTGCAAGNTSKFMVQGNYEVIAASQTGTFSAAPAGPFMMDEWARFMRQIGVPIPGLLNVNGEQVKAQVTTYTIDVFNAQQHPDFSGLLFNAARVGGGKYFQAKNKNALITALRQILTEVQAVNSAFSSASLPVNATNRAQNENQVFIGVFKPDRTKDPGWFGNMKRYQLISTGATIDLGDSLGQAAINNQTGFLTDCAVSFWSVDSGTYWQSAITDDPDALSICASNTTSDYSDSPDGPFVEKGAVAENLRRGNGNAAQDANRNFSVNRNIYMEASGSLVDFDTTNSGLDDETVRYTRGEDVDAFDPNGDGTYDPVVTTKTRSTIHGDVVHSRPQPINYGGTTGVVVFYGANDGHFRAVRASDGRELWSFVARENFDKLARLRKNTPLIRYFGDLAIGSEPKDYLFDGSTGVFQTDDNSKIWIFPTLRRGGRRIYALDVTDPEKPAFLWSAGCDASSCETGYENIGQTWALPNVGFIKAWCGTGGCLDDTTPRRPVIVLSGGYDECDDQNTWSPSCATPTGSGVYVIDAEDGTLVRYFDFAKVDDGFGARSAPSDVALIDTNNDEMVDYAYAVDTGGNVYRMDFIDGPTTQIPIASPDAWSLNRIAYTNGQGRKFLFPPALVQITSTKIYLAIGTGDREHPLRTQYPFDERDADATVDDPGVINRFYVFKDDLTIADSTKATDLDGVTMADYTKDTDCSTDPILPNSSQAGWFMELGAEGQGEQVVTSAVVAAGFVFFSTNRPTEVAETVCVASLGEARGYFMNLLNASGAIGVSGACGGTRSSTFVGGGLPPSPVLATVPIDGQLRTVVIGAVQKTGEPSSPIQSQRVRPPIASDRKPIYWYKSTGDK
jgi:Tfp pilus tip-associated adhesin PilY1